MRDKLKVGDVVFREYSRKWEKGTNYERSIVVRLTKTRAILDNKVQLINKQSKSRSGYLCYQKYGDRYETWRIQTEKDADIINNWQKELNILNWWSFNKEKLTKNQIKQIHELLNN